MSGQRTGEDGAQTHRADAGWYMAEAFLGVLDRVEVTLIPDRGECLGPARPSHQRAMIAAVSQRR
jgi:hypothetical protein